MKRIKNNSSLYSPKGFSMVVFLIVVGILLLTLMGGFLWVRSQMAKNPSLQSERTQEGDTGQPDVPVTDYAPGLPNNQKTAIIVRKDDSSEQKYLISNAMVAGFIKSLPPGNRVISQTPLGK